MTARRRWAIGFPVLRGLALATLLPPSFAEAATPAALCAGANPNPRHPVLWHPANVGALPGHTCHRTTCRPRALFYSAQH